MKNCGNGKEEDERTYEDMEMSENGNEWESNEWTINNEDKVERENWE